MQSSQGDQNIRGRGVNPDPQGIAAGPYANHDMQIRNHLSGLVRAMLQDNKRAELEQALLAHRGFIDEVLMLLQKDRGG